MRPFKLVQFYFLLKNITSAATAQLDLQNYASVLSKLMFKGEPYDRDVTASASDV